MLCLCPGMPVSIDAIVFGVLEKLRLWAPEWMELLTLTGADPLPVGEVTG